MEDGIQGQVSTSEHQSEALYTRALGTAKDCWSGGAVLGHGSKSKVYLNK